MGRDKMMAGITGAKVELVVSTVLRGHVAFSISFFSPIAGVQGSRGRRRNRALCGLPGSKNSPAHTHTHTGVIVQLHSKRVRRRNMDGREQEGGGRRRRNAKEHRGREGTNGPEAEENRTSDEWLRLRASPCVPVRSCPSREQTDGFSRKREGRSVLGGMGCWDVLH